MKAISLWQPYASLIALGAKTIETRSWAPPAQYLETRIAIHAAKTPAHLGLCVFEPFRDYVRDAAVLPLGAVVATARLHRCRPITTDGAQRMLAQRPTEHAFGLYQDGRFAWILRDVIALAPPVPFTGRQGFFDVPDDLLGIEPRQGALL